MCNHCRKPFTAVETAPPHPGLIRTFHDHQLDSIPHLTDGRKKSRDNNNVDPLESGGGAVYTGTITAAHGSQAIPRESPTKRAAAAASASASPSTNPPPKRRKVVEAGSNVGSSSSAPPPALTSSVREFSKEELKNVLLKKAKPTIVTNLRDLMTVAPETEHVNMANNAGSSSQDKSGAIESFRVGPLTIKVPHPDFSDFNKNRTEKSFSDDQIWACYPSSEGMMPRVYFRIDKVLSVDPFKVCITMLNTSDPLGLGVRRTCGVFTAGSTQICKSPYIFSHKVEAAKGDHGEFLIYPRTGEVWALYKNWSHDSEGEYDVVEVVEGYTEEYGVTVVPLMKVAGFTSVFRHYLNPQDFRSFSKDELSRFSHQIPSRLLPGPDELRGCQELDPAATPSQFLKVIDG
ncbi:DNAJ heat shock N-terminal domain-containing protein [Raphanus sativus]|nr:DNAJ heat shock N-terminal domain-containing protein [Raphanus sativus]